MLTDDERGPLDDPLLALKSDGKHGHFAVGIVFPPEERHTERGSPYGSRKRAVKEGHRPATKSQMRIGNSVRNV